MMWLLFAIFCMLVVLLLIGFTSPCLWSLVRYCKVKNASFHMQLSLCFNFSRAIFPDFLKMAHESRFDQPSKTTQNDICCFTHNFAPLR